MDQSQRGGRYYNQGEGGRGSLDDRIGYSDYGRAGGKYFGARNRGEHISYDDKPAPRNFEDRVHTDSRTLEDRISVATPTAKKFTPNLPIGEGNGHSRTGGNYPPAKQIKKTQNKVHKQAHRATEAVVLTDQQEEINNGMNNLAKGTHGTGKSHAPVTISQDMGMRQNPVPANQPLGRLGVVTNLSLLQKDGQGDGLSPSSMAESGTPSPMATTLQEQLREKVLASLKKKAEAQVAQKEKDVVSSTPMMPISTKQTESIETEEPRNDNQLISGNQSSLLALEQSLNFPPTKRKVDLERDAAVDAMLAEVQATSEKASHQKAPSFTKHDDMMEITPQNMPGGQPTHDTIVAPPPTKRPTTSVSDAKLNSPRESKTSVPTPRSGNSDIASERDYRESDKDAKLDAKQKPKKLPPIQIASHHHITHQSNSAKEANRGYNFLEFEDDEDDIQKDSEKPLSATSREQLQGAYNRLRVSDEERQSNAERRPRYWEERNEIQGREAELTTDDARRYSDKPPARSHTKDAYREEIYHSNGVTETRDGYFLAPRLPPMAPSARPIPPDEYSYPAQEYASYSGPRYLPLRADEHLNRQPEYDPYYKDLAEWLEVTGYHDIAYRQTALRRHRDRELDRLYALRVAAATASREELASPLDVRVRGGTMMPPPQPPTRGPLPEVAVRPAPRAIGYATRPSQQGDRPNSHRFSESYIIAPSSPESVSLKRRISQEDEYDMRPPEKATRLSYDAAIRVPPLPLDEELLEYRNSRLDPIDNGGSTRRHNDTKDSEKGAMAPTRRRPVTPVREIQEKASARSPSPNRYHDNEHRKIAQKDVSILKGRQHPESDEQANSYRGGKKFYEKGGRRFGTPDSSPKTEKGYHKVGGGYDSKGGAGSDTKGGRVFNNQGKFSNAPDDRRFSHSFDNHDEMRGSGQGNYNNRRRGSFDEVNRKKFGYMRGNEHGRDWYQKGDRKDRSAHNRPNMNSDQMDIDIAPGGSNSDTKYFIVKSFNHDNVLHAQRDGIWATQEKNAEVFNDAFQTARDVILIFSVNKSGKFQGYARMESAPGSADTPVWAKGLLWKSSGAFHIRWITICDIGFYHLATLLNRLNEDQPVFIGRDGQEIDPETGAALCSIVDDRASSMH